MFRIILKRLREENKISQQQLANVLKVSQSTVGMWENGKNKPEFDTLIKIADYFNVSVDFLLGKSDNKKTPTDENTDGRINTVKIRGRDGSFLEKHLTDEQITLIKGMIEQFPEADFE